ncbi:mitochondrial resolvase Ydc2 [Lipomyces kononenkoae]|uniref:Mitochondrial resolvase Ydc2 n=1 Tax=Lipomyces kononenkoae TaxID=34357 RepID=A0ACC3T9D5_LIPKO
MASFQKLSVESLKSLSRLCGLSSSHTKQELILNLNEAIWRNSLSTQSNSSSSSSIWTRPPHTHASSTQSHHRVLSVDMGLRNLSYSVLDLADVEQIPTLSAWSLKSILPQTALAELTTATTRQQPNFSPAIAAQLAYGTFVEDILPRFNPDTILLERQRHRSGGGRNVLEWTLKVNMFESVLYGVLTTLIKQGLLKAQVCEVLPSRTKGYWIRNAVIPTTTSSQGSPQQQEGGGGADESISSGRKRVQNKYALSKLVKVNLVKRWTKGVTFDNPAACKHVLFTESTIPMALQFHSEPGGSARRRRRRKPDSSDIGVEQANRLLDQQQQQQQEPPSSTGTKLKLDDLSDSLLQGVAFVQWHQNRFELARAVRDGTDLAEFCQLMVDRHTKEMVIE